MKSFYDFFNSSKERFTPNTRTHHQNAMRSINRKHQNQVARSHGHERQKEDPIINNIVKYNKKGVWPLNVSDANRILKTYGINHIPNKNYRKSINRTGIDIAYNNATKKFTLSRNG
jgi:hypothetical protein